MYKRICKIGRLIGIVMIMLLMAGCEEKNGSAKGNIEITNPIELEIPQVSEQDFLDKENLLTGLNDLSEEAIGKRPVAVMVNNVAAALPQYGVEAADVIFEIPVEGNQTRLMALYGDYTAVPKVCSIRSCRYYFPAFAKGFDAFYVHWGLDRTITDYLNSLYPDRLDGLSNTGGLYGRDSQRKSSGYAMEHTGYFDGTGFAAYADRKLRTELSESKTGTAFQFNGVGELISPEGDSCQSVYINFGAQTATLTFDEETGTYLKKINGSKHIDGKTGNQLSFTNVFILETSIYTRDEKGHKSVDWSGESKGTGYYISNGAVQKIRWSKADENAYLRFFDESGNEIKINRGKSYIAVNNAGKATFTE